MTGFRVLAFIACLAWTTAVVADDSGQWPVGTVGTMWHDPYLVGSYRHWDQIYDVRTVAAGPVASALPMGAPLPAIDYWVDGTHRTLDDYIAAGRMTGLIVLKDGRIRLERYATGADESSLMTTESVAKSFLSVLVGIALKDGRIASLDDPIGKYVPELVGTAYGGVPIEAALQMSSGIAFNEAYGDPGSDSAKLWSGFALYRTRSALDIVAAAKAAKPPYAIFNYKGIDPLAVGLVLQRATGMTLADDLSRKLWRPLGMEADANWQVGGPRDDPSEVAYCCLNARLRDWARFGLLMAQDGVWRGKRILPRGWVARSTIPSRDQVMPGRLYPGYPLGYQYLWWAVPGRDHAFVAKGINGQFIYVDPARDLVVAESAVWHRFWDDKLEREFYAIVDRIAQLTDGN